MRVSRVSFNSRELTKVTRESPRCMNRFEQLESESLESCQLMLDKSLRKTVLEI